MLFEIYKKQVKYVCKRIYKYKGDDRNPIWDFTQVSDLDFEVEFIV